MKYIPVILACTAMAFLLPMCKKNGNDATCTTCSGNPVIHGTDAAGVSYYVPTAFTPNGDGRNDIFRIVYDKLDTSSVITIWDMKGREVYKGNITKAWEGTDTKGNLCAAGKYPVLLALKDVNGVVTSTCACVNLLKYSGTCLATNGATYYFIDQIDPATGFAWPSAETFCP